MFKNNVSGIVFGLLLTAGTLGFTHSASAQTIVDVASGNPSFTSLVGAVSAQGLVTTLQGPGPFTVFAPTNDAFANIPGFIKKALDRDPALLKQVLLYHVVAGDIKAADVVKLTSAKTVQGSKAKIQVENGKVKIDYADVVQTDIKASNGTVHVINQVIVPRSIIVTAAMAELQDILAKINMIKDEGTKLDSGM